MTSPLLIGEIAALGAALCWAIGPVIFASIIPELGAVATNRIRLLLALFYLLLLNLLLHHEWLPRLSWDGYLFLGLSGLIGLAVGDTFFYASLARIGPRIAALFGTFVPIYGAILAWFTLHETLATGPILGIVLTVSGVMWVVYQRHGGVISAGQSNRKRALAGIVFGVLAGVCQAVGMIFAKRGMQGMDNPLGATIIRILAAGIVLWIGAVYRSNARQTLAAMISKRYRVRFFVAAFLGSTLGIWWSIVAIRYAPIGIAAALLATSPVIMIPITRKFLNDRITPGAIFGTILAVVGVIVLLNTAH